MSICYGTLHYIIQNAIITVCEVEHQKTLNTEIGKQTFWFCETVKEFYRYYQENTKNGRHQKVET